VRPLTWFTKPRIPRLVSRNDWRGVICTLTYPDEMVRQNALMELLGCGLGGGRAS